MSAGSPWLNYRNEELGDENLSSLYSKYYTSSETEPYEVRSVWAANCFEEFCVIRQLTKRYKYVVVNTKYPGLIFKSDFPDQMTDHTYDLMQRNVNLLQVIQIGLSFFDCLGNLAIPNHTWQFNFKFDLDKDTYAPEAVDLMAAVGIPFDKHRDEGIVHTYFAELLITSGLVMANDITWVGYNCLYDFGYLMRLVSNFNLPTNEYDFLQGLYLHFRRIYDLKYLIGSCKHLCENLDDVASQLQIYRTGSKHNSGSDALLTGRVFFKIKSWYFENMINDKIYCGRVCGLCSRGAIVNFKQDLHAILNENF